MLPLSLDSPFTPTRGRFCLDDKCLKLEDSESYQASDYMFDYTMSTFTLRRPVPCPEGLYCHPGTGVSESNMKNFSTPQPCFETMYCPEGSDDPRGQGECPQGFYCPFGIKLACPVGTHCPREGQYDPLPCIPGTFNAQLAMTRCTPCPRGYICPGFGRVAPAICPPGFACSRIGLRSPNHRCIAGYYCNNGTETIDPLRNDTSLRPYPCTPGTYCLSGVGYSTVKLGDFLYAQNCTEGFYCEAASNSPRGSGLCPPGFVCPYGTATPQPTPRGSYAELPGTIFPEKCLPGTYAPTIETSVCYKCPPGTSCTGEGTYIANLCGPGTYRSANDSTLIPCQSCPQGTWSKNYGLTEMGECIKCPPGVVCPLEGMTEPCSFSDLPTPYTPIIKFEGSPAFEYLFDPATKPTYYATFACLALNVGYSTGTMTSHSQTYFFGELVPPYIDVLGRGPNFRATDQLHLKYQSTAKCYMNNQKYGSSVYQRISNYHGPMYDIQYGHDSNGFSKIFPNGTYYYSGFFGPGSLAIDLPSARKFEPSFNCTNGFSIMNESTILYNVAGLSTSVYTDANNDIGGQSRLINQGIDQFYPGTCEADLICYQTSDFIPSSSPFIITQLTTRSESCAEGFLCDEGTDTDTSDNFLCRAGYVCDFGTTPDPSLHAPQGQFAKLCPAGYVCGDGTGPGQEHEMHCPVGYYCPTGTGDHLTGLMAGDAVNRGLSAEDSDPFNDVSHVLYTVDNDVRVISLHDSRCFEGSDTALGLRYAVDWIPEMQELNNPYLSYLSKATPGREVPYSNDPDLTGHDVRHRDVQMDTYNYISNYTDSVTLPNTSQNSSSVQQQYYRPVTTRRSLKSDLLCGRDHKWRLTDQAIYRKECDCSNFFKVVIAVYRFWLCTSGILMDLGLGSTIIPIFGKRDFWFTRGHAKGTQCVFQNSSNINTTHGAIEFDYLKSSVGTPHGSSFLNLTGNSTFQFTWTQSRIFATYSDLYKSVYAEYNLELQQFPNRTAFDPYIFDLKNALEYVEEYGTRLDDLVWLVDGYDHNNVFGKSNTPGRLDMCQCERLTLCPNGTMSPLGSTSVSQCVRTSEVLRRVSVIPLWYNLSTPGLVGHLANISDFTELGGGDLSLPMGMNSYPVGSILLQPNDEAVVSLDFRNLLYNVTYGSHYQIGVYINCKPCPTRYICSTSGSSPACSTPTLTTQQSSYQNCLAANRMTSCMLSDGTRSNCSDPMVQHNSTFLEPDKFKCDQIPYFCDPQMKPASIWKILTDPVTGRALNRTAQEKSSFIPNPTDSSVMFIPGCCACEAETMPYYFIDSSTIDDGYPDNKHNFVQMSFQALEAVSLTIVVELLHGQYYAEFDNFVKGKSDVYVHRPSRASYNLSTPSRASFLAILTQGLFANMDLPLNIPPLENDNSNGAPVVIDRVLIGRLSDIRKGDPQYVSRLKKRLTDVFIDQKAANITTASSVSYDTVPSYEELNNNLYSVQTPGQAVSYPYNSSYIGLPYFPFFSNCRGGGRYLSISKVLETDPSCDLVSFHDTVPVSAYPWKNKHLGNGDKCNSSTINISQPFNIGNEAFSPWYDTYHGALYDCEYEEQISTIQNNVRWYELGLMQTLFYIGE